MGNVSVILLSLFVFASVAFGSPPFSLATEHRGETKTVAILQLGSHPIIDTVVQHLVEGLLGWDQAHISTIVANGNFDPTTLRQAARDLVERQPDVLVSVTTPATQAALSANAGRIPLVFTFVSNPPDVGYTGPGSLANVTGLSDKVAYEPVINAITQIIPKARLIGYLLTTSEANAVLIHAEFKGRLEQMGITILTAAITSSAEVPQAARTIGSEVDAFLVGGDNNVVSAARALVNVANSFQKPVFCVDSSTVEVGCIVGAAIDYERLGTETAEIVKQVLSGAPADTIPLQDFSEFHLFVNNVSARRLGIIVPDSVLDAATIID